ncbi:MAG: hypothetical protein ACK4OM_05880 [Alphaproteobacteria bacterium]
MITLEQQNEFFKLVDNGHVEEVKKFISSNNMGPEEINLFQKWELLKNWKQNEYLSNSSITAIYIAMYNDNTEMADLLIEKGADVNAKDCEGSTSIHNLVDFIKRSLVNGDFKIKTSTRNFLKSLKAKYNVNLNVRDKENHTLLHKVIVLNNVYNIIPLLIDAGYDPTLEFTYENKEYGSVLHYLCGCNKPIDYWISQSAALGKALEKLINYRHSDGNTALFEAIRSPIHEKKYHYPNHIESEISNKNDNISFLLDKGAKINLVNKEMKTLLHLFCDEPLLLNSHIEIIRKLAKVKIFYMPSGTSAELSKSDLAKILELLKAKRRQSENRSLDGKFLLSLNNINHNSIHSNNNNAIDLNGIGATEYSYPTIPEEYLLGNTETEHPTTTTSTTSYDPANIENTEATDRIVDLPGIIVEKLTQESTPQKSEEAKQIDEILKRIEDLSDFEKNPLPKREYDEEKSTNEFREFTQNVKEYTDTLNTELIRRAREFTSLKKKLEELYGRHSSLKKQINVKQVTNYFIHELIKKSDEALNSQDRSNGNFNHAPITLKEGKSKNIFNKKRKRNNDNSDLIMDSDSENELTEELEKSEKIERITVEKLLKECEKEVESKENIVINNLPVDPRHSAKQNKKNGNKRFNHFDESQDYKYFQLNDKDLEMATFLTADGTKKHLSRLELESEEQDEREETEEFLEKLRKQNLKRSKRDDGTSALLSFAEAINKELSLVEKKNFNKVIELGSKALLDPEKVTADNKLNIEIDLSEINKENIKDVPIFGILKNIVSDEYTSENIENALNKKINDKGRFEFIQPDTDSNILNLSIDIEEFKRLEEDISKTSLLTR